MTLAVSMRNLDNGEPRTYVQRVKDFETPQTLTSWLGHHYLGSGDTSVGPHYRVRLMSVPLAPARVAENTRRPEP